MKNDIDSYFLDSNILVNISIKNERGIKCINFLEKKKNFTTPHILEESYYNLLILKAKELEIHEKKWEILKFLKTNQKFIYQQARMLFLPFMNIISLIKVLPVNSQIFLNSMAIMRKYALLPLDALTIAAMDYYNINKMVSYDSDFDRVEWIKRIAP